jgi:hypothetical protein
LSTDFAAVEAKGKGEEEKDDELTTFVFFLHLDSLT